MKELKNLGVIRFGITDFQLRQSSDQVIVELPDYF